MNYVYASVHLARGPESGIGMIGGGEAEMHQCAEMQAAQAGTLQLKLANELFDSAFEDAMIGMALLDKEGRLVRANEELAQMVGRAKADLEAMPLADLVGADSSNLNELLGGNSQKVQCRRQDGGSASVTFKASWLPGNAFYLAQFLDITERTQVEMALRQARKLESVGLLAKGIAHEINTPIQYVGDNLRFLQESFEELDEVLLAATAPSSCDVEYLRQEMPLALTQALQGVERVAIIVRSIKEYSHCSNKEWDRVDIHKLLDNTVVMSRNEWKYVAELTTDFDPQMPEVVCNRAEIGQVFLNVIVNAAQAIEEHPNPAVDPGKIHIATQAKGEVVEVRISDTGGGIPEAIRHRIFDSSFTTKEIGKGSGQGLAISQEFILKHGGQLGLETEVGQGTCFIIQLPVIAKGASDKTDKLEACA